MENGEIAGTSVSNTPTPYLCTEKTSSDLAQWPDFAPAVTATSDTASVVETDAKINHPKRFHRVTRTALAPFDSNGFD